VRFTRAFATAALAALAACDGGDAPEANQVPPPPEANASDNAAAPVASEGVDSGSNTAPPPQPVPAPSPQPIGAPPPAAPPPTAPPVASEPPAPALEQDYTTGNDHGAHPPH